VTLAFKLDTQLRKAFTEYMRRKGATKSQAARALLRHALGVPERDGAAAEVVMRKVGDAKRAIATAARR
jgi:hypothetical protein